VYVCVFWCGGFRCCVMRVSRSHRGGGANHAICKPTISTACPAQMPVEITLGLCEHYRYSVGKSGGWLPGTSTLTAGTSRRQGGPISLAYYIYYVLTWYYKLVYAREQSKLYSVSLMNASGIMNNKRTARRAWKRRGHDDGRCSS
jgi:hypothetical protein